MHHCHELHRHVTTTSRHCCNSFPSDKQASMGKGDDNQIRLLTVPPLHALEQFLVASRICAYTPSTCMYFHRYTPIQYSDHFALTMKIGV